MTDNGTDFVNQEFETFLRKNGIKHLTSAPCHPASNGLQRVVQIFKSNISKLSEGSIEDKLSHLLFYNHITPQTTTGLSPAELLQGRCLRSRLDLIKPEKLRKENVYKNTILTVIKDSDLLKLDNLFICVTLDKEMATGTDTSVS